MALFVKYLKMIAQKKRRAVSQRASYAFYGLPTAMRLTAWNCKGATNRY
jgi:hypothetical protein